MTWMFVLWCQSLVKKFPLSHRSVYPTICSPCLKCSLAVHLTILSNPPSSVPSFTDPCLRWDHPLITLEFCKFESYSQCPFVAPLLSACRCAVCSLDLLITQDDILSPLLPFWSTPHTVAYLRETWFSPHILASARKPCLIPPVCSQPSPLTTHWALGP